MNCSPRSCLRGFLFASLGGLALGAQAQSFEFVRMCEERLPPPSLLVEHAENGYQVDTRLSFRDLSGMGAGLLRHGKQNVLGLTRTETSATVEVRLSRLRDEESGQECLSPRVRLTIGYSSPITVYIGREFPPDSCSYREIYQHEMRHVRVYQHYLPQVESAVRAHIDRHFNRRILYGDHQEVETRLKKEIQDVWLPLVDSEIHKVDGLQALIDSPEEYDRMENVCEGELQRLINSDSGG